MTSSRSQEIRTYEAPTRIANTPEFIKGVMNLRGTIVPIVDLRVKFGLPRGKATTTRPWSIVLNVAKRTVGVVVDGGFRRDRAARRRHQAAAGVRRRARHAYLQGLATVGGRMLIVIDIERLMSSRAWRSWTKRRHRNARVARAGRRVAAGGVSSPMPSSAIRSWYFERVRR